jgi:hypothetical protein
MQIKQFLISVTFFAIYVSAGSQDLITPYENSGKTETFTYQEILEWSHKLDVLSEQIYYVNIGQSGNGYDIPMLIADKDGLQTAKEVKEANKAILLIQAGIHAGEPDGTDAGFLLFKDFVEGKIDIPKGITILFLPTINPDGCIRRSKFNRINQNGPTEMGWRTTADYINMNRDFLKAESVEIRAFLKVFNEWLPDFFIDCHTTDGADYQYVVTYDLTCLGNMGEEHNYWQKERYLKPIKSKMDETGFPIFRYVTFKRWHDPRSGLRNWIASPILSEGYSAVQNRPGLLIETHMLKPYHLRVEGTYQMIYHTMLILDEESENISRINDEADIYAASDEFKSKPFPLSFDSTGDSTMVIFKGVEYDIDTSELTGGLIFNYTDKPIDFELAYFDKLKPVDLVYLPDAYIFEPVWKDVVELLDYHNIRYYRTKSMNDVNLEAYKFSNVVFSDSPYEGRQRIINYDLEIKDVTRNLPSGSIIVPINQRSARLIAHMFEPQSSASLVMWGFFNRVFEQKEYSESYVMEPLAIEMLANNEDLKKEYEEFIANNPEIINNQWAMLNWFYQRTDYWDSWKNVYPVFRFKGDFNELVK